MGPYLQGRKNFPFIRPGIGAHFWKGGWLQTKVVGGGLFTQNEGMPSLLDTFRLSRGVMIEDCWLLCILVGGFKPNHLKNMLVKLDHSPSRGENKKN